MVQPPSVQTSLTLLSRVGASDQAAWDTFTSLYGPLVYSWCRNAGLSPDDVDDAGQEVFRTVAVKLETFEPGRKSSGAFRSWLWGITRLEILKHFRARRHQPVGEGGTDNNLNMQRLASNAEEPEAMEGVPPQQLLLRSAIEILKSEFDPRTWQAFWDLAVKGRPAREIGEEIDMTPKAVRQAKYRVTKKLRDLLDDDFPDLIAQIPGVAGS